MLFLLVSCAIFRNADFSSDCFLSDNLSFRPQKRDKHVKDGGCYQQDRSFKNVPQKTLTMLKMEINTRDSNNDLIR